MDPNHKLPVNAIPSCSVISKKYERSLLDGHQGLDDWQVTMFPLGAENGAKKV